ARRIEDRARTAVESLSVDRRDPAPNRRFAIRFDQFPDIVMNFLQNGIVMAALFGMNHALFEIEQLRRCDLNALDADSRTMAVGPQVARENVAEKISLHDLMVLDARGKAVLPLELRVGPSMVAAWVDGVGLPDI